MTEIFAAD